MRWFLAVTIAAMVACGSAESTEQLRERLELAEREKREARKEAERLQAERRSGLTITLPEGQRAEIDVTRVSIVVEVPVDGDVVISGTAMPIDDLDKLFRAAFDRDKTTQVVIQADKGVAHGRVVGIMERAKAAGLTRLAIGTRPSGGSLGAP